MIKAKTDGAQKRHRLEVKHPTWEATAQKKFTVPIKTENDEICYTPVKRQHIKLCVWVGRYTVFINTLLLLHSSLFTLHSFCCFRSVQTGLTFPAEGGLFQSSPSSPPARPERRRRPGCSSRLRTTHLRERKRILRFRLPVKACCYGNQGFRKQALTLLQERRHHGAQVAELEVKIWGRICKQNKITRH